MKHKEDRSVWRGVVAGAVGGLFGSLVLEAFMVGAQSLHEKHLKTELDQSGPAHQVADLLARKMTNTPSSGTDRAIAGEAVHYAFGAVVGGFYGGLSEYLPWTRFGAGALFGTGVFLAADELSMPALGLVAKPTQETAQGQAEHWLAHLAYGVSTELARKTLRSLL